MILAMYLRLLLGVLLTLPAAAAVKYEIPNAWAFTAPDFLQGTSFRIPASDLSSCAGWGNCAVLDSMNIMLNNATTNPPTYYTWVWLTRPDTPPTATGFFQADLRTPGIYGPLQISVNDGPVIYMPEPAQYGLLATGMVLIGALRRRYVLVAM